MFDFLPALAEAFNILKGPNLLDQASSMIKAISGFLDSAWPYVSGIAAFMVAALKRSRKKAKELATLLDRCPIENSQLEKIAFNAKLGLAQKEVQKKRLKSAKTAVKKSNRANILQNLKTQGKALGILRRFWYWLF